MPDFDVTDAPAPIDEPAGSPTDDDDFSIEVDGADGRAGDANEDAESAAAPGDGTDGADAVPDEVIAEGSAGVAATPPEPLTEAEMVAQAFEAGRTVALEAQAGYITSLEAQLAMRAEAAAALHDELTTLTGAATVTAAGAKADLETAAMHYESAIARATSAESQLASKTQQLADAREQVVAAGDRHAALLCDLAAKSLWLVDVQPKDSGPRARIKLLVIASDAARAMAKAQSYGKGDVLAVTANTTQVLVFDELPKG